ncbi:MAG: hypothetical protein QM756_27090 [Polyangiaceae bacterium]
MPIAQSYSMSVFGSTNHPSSAVCSQELLNTLGTLTPLSPNFNSMGLDVLPECFDGTSGTFGNRFEDLVPTQPTFAAQLAARANQTAPGSNLTATQIAARLMFGGTCIGCHFRPDETKYRDLGQGLTLPVTTALPGELIDDVAFTQVNNLRLEPCAASGADAAQNCFKLSPTLGGIFLPHRKAVLEAYLNTPVGTFQPPAPGTKSALTIGGTPNARTH